MQKINDATISQLVFANFKKHCSQMNCAGLIKNGQAKGVDTMGMMREQKDEYKKDLSGLDLGADEGSWLAAYQFGMKDGQICVKFGVRALDASEVSWGSECFLLSDEHQKIARQRDLRIPSNNTTFSHGRQYTRKWFASLGLGAAMPPNNSKGAENGK